MKYVHVRNLEKYHPGYKDRSLQWAKIYFNMVQGDPDCEMIDDEVDFARLIKFIILELQAKKPIPVDNSYLQKKGFNLKKRSIELTLRSLHNFLVIDTQLSESSIYSLSSSLSSSNNLSNSISTKEERFPAENYFEEIWKKYPNSDGKKAAKKSFLLTVKTEEDWKNINIALGKYKICKKVRKGFIKNGSTWFNNWQDWTDYKEEGGVNDDVLSEDEEKRAKEYLEKLDNY